MLGPPEAAFPRPVKGRFAKRGIRAYAVGKIVEARQFAAAGKGHERYFFPRPGLESHRGASGNIEPHAESGGAIELHCLVDLEEMEMRSDLDRPVAGIASLQFDRAASGVYIDIA